MLAAKADEFDDVVKIGRTHLMDAVPIRLGQEFSGYGRQIELAIERIEATLAWFARAGHRGHRGWDRAEYPPRVWFARRQRAVENDGDRVPRGRESF